MEWPLVSIIIAAQNSVSTLPAAIAGALSQDYANLEVLIIDDASEDGTGELLWEYRLDARVRYVRNTERRGYVRMLNTGLRKAQGDFICVLAPEDRFLPGYIRTQMTAFAENPGLDVMQCGVYIMDERGRLLTKRDDPLKFSYGAGRNEFAELLSSNSLPVFGSLLARRAVYDRHGHFDPHGGRCADFELLVRWAQADVQMGYTPLPLLAYRLHSTRLIGSQSSFDDGTLLRDTLAITLSALTEEHAFRIEGYEQQICRRLERLFAQTIKAGYVDVNGAAEASVQTCVEHLRDLAKRNIDDALPPSLSVIVLARGTQRDLEKTLASLLLQDEVAWDALVIHPRHMNFSRFCDENDPHHHVRFAVVDKMPSDAAALNMAVHTVSGQVLSFLRAGTTVAPHHLQKLLNTFAHQKNQVVVSGALVLVNDTILHGEADAAFPAPEYFEGILVAPTFPLDALTIRRSALDTVGYFNEQLSIMPEWEYLLRLHDYYHFTVLDDSPVHLRCKVGASHRYAQNPALAEDASQIFAAFPAENDNVERLRAAYLAELGKLFALGAAATWTAEGILQLHKRASGEQIFENELHGVRGFEKR